MMQIRKPSRRRQITLVEDFSPKAADVRERVRDLNFGPQEYKGHSYQGIGLMELDMSAEISEAMGFPVKQELDFFRLGVAGDATTVWIHCDSVCADWAGIWYLTPNEYGRSGTAFWRHLATGWNRLPAGGVTQAEADALNRDGQDQSRWALEEIVRMRFNRFVAYPTALFHSRWPKFVSGKGFDDGRLIWCCFFNEVRT